MYESRLYRLVPTILLFVGLTASAADFSGLSTEARQLKSAVEAAPSGEDAPLASLGPAGTNVVMLKPVDAAPSELERKVSENLGEPSVMEGVQTGVAQTQLEQFGYDIFSSVPSTFAAVAGMPVPEDYIIGPGDTFVVQVFSGTDVQYRLVVTREGSLLVPEVGALQVAGLNFAETKTLLKESLERLRIGTKAIVTLSELKAIQVLMVGEVIQPGSYTVSGLSSLLNTLVSTGGIKRTGSLRNIQVKRSGQLIAVFDLYELLLKGSDSNNVYLRQGDVVFVPPIGTTVSVAGEIQRPAIYELKDESSVSDVIALSGGVLPTGAKSKTKIERIANDDGYTLIQADLNRDGGRIEVLNGDLIRVLPVLEKYDNIISIGGSVTAPGSYEWRSGMRLSDVLAQPSMLRQGVDFDFGLVERENRETKRTEVQYFNLRAALEDIAANNIELLPRDRIYVFNTHENRSQQLASIVQKLKRETTQTKLASTVDLKGAVKHPGEYPLAPNLRVLDLIELSGGLQTGFDQEYSLLARTNAEDGSVELTSISLREAKLLPAGDHNPVLMPTDRLYIFDSNTNRAELLTAEIAVLKAQTPFGQLAPLVSVDGSVNNPGTYPMTPGMRVEDLLRATGGMKESAFGASGVLARRVLQQGEYTRVDQYQVALTTRSVVSENLDTILQPYDQLSISQKPEWLSTPKRVTIEGEVTFPGTYSVDKRETLCGIIQRVGGFTENAYLFGTVFLRESVRAREQKALDRMLEQLDDLLAEVHLSPGYQNDQKLPANQSSDETYKIIKGLAPQKALGRLVIDMEGAVTHCDERSDLVLEDGDKIIVPKYLDEVSVVGQVYFPTSHKYRSERAALDYINLSGGTKELAQREHAYVVQANGEVISVRSRASTWGWLLNPTNIKVTPGSTIYVPLSVDRINGREFSESWIDMFYKLTIGVASLDYLFL